MADFFGTKHPIITSLFCAWMGANAYAGLCSYEEHKFENTKIDRPARLYNVFMARNVYNISLITHGDHVPQYMLRHAPGDRADSAMLRSIGNLGNPGGEQPQYIQGPKSVAGALFYAGGTCFGEITGALTAALTN